MPHAGSGVSRHAYAVPLLDRLHATTRLQRLLTPAGDDTVAGVVRCWLSRHAWLTQLRAQLHTDRGQALCRTEHIAPDTLLIVAATFARYADTATGRSCRPGLNRVVTQSRCSLTVVHRTKRVLAPLDMLTRVQGGRHMTLVERTAALDAGQQQLRRIASVYALHSPRHPVSVDDGTPPRSGPHRAHKHLPKWSSSARKRPGEGAPRPAKTRPPKRRSPNRDNGTLQMIDQIRARVPWLRKASTTRLYPALHRFATRGWTTSQLLAAADRVLATRGWVIPTRLHHPELYLATLLGDIDHATPPTHHDGSRIDEQTARRDAHAAAVQARADTTTAAAWSATIRTSFGEHRKPRS